MTLATVVTGVLGLAAVFGTHILSRSYCRVRGVEEENATLFVLAPVVGILLGAVVWTGVRLATPEMVESSVEYGIWLRVTDSLVVSALLLGVIDAVGARWVFDEPSFAEAREMYLDYGGCDTDGEDWIDAIYFGERHEVTE